MIEKPKRPKKIPNQDNKQPQTIQELIRRYDLDNTKIYDFLDELVGSLKQEQVNVEAELSIKANSEDVEDILATKENTGTVLFENTNGDSGDIIKLSDTITNYKEVKIDYVINMTQYTINDSKRTPITSGNCVSLNLVIAHSEMLQLFVAGRYLFSDNTVSKQFSTRTRIVNDKTIDWDGNVSIYITKITGYK